jgi:hypothetical protein
MKDRKTEPGVDTPTSLYTPTSLSPTQCPTTFVLMTSVDKVEKLALGLPERQHPILAAHLLDSLSPILEGADEGMVEALRRDAGFDAHATSGISLEELDRHVANRRR